MPMSETEETSRPQETSRPLLRIGLVVFLFVASFAVLYALDVSPLEVLEWLKHALVEMGAFGILLFVAAFIVGELIHIPGLVFVAAAVYAYGTVTGGLVGYVGAVLSVSVSFWIVRLVGGQSLGELKFKIVQRLLARLDERPILIVLVLRLILWMAPPLNYLLAMSTVRFRDYFIGSAVGLIAPVGLASVFIDMIVEWLLSG